MVVMKEQTCSTQYLWFDQEKELYAYGSVSHFNKISSNNQRKTAFQLILKTDSFSEKLIERVVYELNSTRSDMIHGFNLKLC